jgi:hypothetical protein
MFRLLKTLLLALLMLVLPLQGFAAAVGLSCGSGHQQHGLLAIAGAHAHSHKGHEHHAVHDVGSQAGDANDHQSGDSADAQAFASSCSACAACCVGAVIPPSALILAPQGHGILTAIAAPDTLFPGHIPDGLKRPPRSLFV